MSLDTVADAGIEKRARRELDGCDLDRMMGRLLWSDLILISETRQWNQHAAPLEANPESLAP